jgi:hypothetical protein
MLSYVHHGVAPLEASLRYLVSEKGSSRALMAARVLPTAARHSARSIQTHRLSRRVAQRTDGSTGAAKSEALPFSVAKLTLIPRTS